MATSDSGAADESDSNFLVDWYRGRIGDPDRDDEAYGYWMFALGALLGVLGVIVFLMSDPATETRELAITLGASGLVFLLAGPVIRLPLRPVATYVTLLGALLAMGAVGWFVTVFPQDWSRDTGDPQIIGLYAAGLGLIAVGGILVPQLTSAYRLRAEGADAEAARLQGESERKTEAIEDLDERLAEVEGERDELESQVEALQDSQAQFELYEDRAGQYRWRLRHLNGNVIADSGEGYTRRSNAQKGLNSVKRNALGAAVVRLEAVATGDAASIEDIETAHVEELESRATFEVYEDDAGEGRWRLVHDNGNVIADSGEGYASVRNARRAVDSVRRTAPRAEYLRIEPTAFEIYRDRAGEYRWRLLHRNGNVLADGGEGYATRRGARNGIESVRSNVVEADDGEVTIETYEDARGNHRWRARHENGNVIADSSEGYATESNLEEAIDRFREYAPDADVLDVGEAAFEIYEDEGEEYRWRLRHRNGNILADSGEGYDSRSNAIEAVDSVKRNVPGAGIEESD